MAPPAGLDRFLSPHLHTLLLSLQRLLGHLDQPVLGLAVGEVGNGRNGLLGVLLRQGAGLLDAVAHQDEFTCLITGVVSHHPMSLRVSIGVL